MKGIALTDGREQSVFPSPVPHSTNIYWAPACARHSAGVWAMMENRRQGPRPHGLTFEVCV